MWWYVLLFCTAYLIRKTGNRTTASSWENVSSGVSDQARHKPACAATETSWSLEISAIESRDIILSKQRITKALIRLRECAGWSAPLLFAYDIRHISHGPSQVFIPGSATYNEPRNDKTHKVTVRPAKIGLGIRPVWSESSLCAQWVGS